MAKTNPSAVARTRRKKHTKKTIRGTTARPRLCVFRSDRHIYVQVIDDTLGRTLAQASSMKLEMPEGADGGTEAPGRCGPTPRRRTGRSSPTGHNSPA